MKKQKPKHPPGTKFSRIRGYRTLSEVLSADGTESRRQSYTKDPHTPLAAVYSNPHVGRLREARQGGDRSHQQLIQDYSRYIESYCSNNGWRAEKFTYFDLADVILFRYVHDDPLTEREAAAILKISKTGWRDVWKPRAEQMSDWAERIYRELMVKA